MLLFVPYRRQFRLELNHRIFSRSFPPPLHMAPDTTEGSKKRKRDVDVPMPRITYIAASRTFDRLFKGNDLGSWLNNAVNSFHIRGFFGRYEGCCPQETGTFYINSGVSFPNS